MCTKKTLASFRSPLSLVSSSILESHAGITHAFCFLLLVSTFSSYAWYFIVLPQHCLLNYCAPIKLSVVLTAFAWLKKGA